jgi:hypothetical protein
MPEVFRLNSTITKEKEPMGTHEIKRRRASSRYVAVCALAVLLVSGCARMEDTNANFANAIDKYYSYHPSCVWPENLQFPIQEDASDPKEVRGYDALVHQELLVRTAGKSMTVADGPQAPTNSYDLSSKGRSEWTIDQQKPGFGNFCYGYRTVTNIDSATPTTSKTGATTDVVYRYSIRDVPDWAKSAEVKADFPGLQADLSATQVGRATLTDNALKGWQVTGAPWAHISDSDIYK